MSRTSKDAVAKGSKPALRKYTSGAIRADVRKKQKTGEIEDAIQSPIETGKFNGQHKVKTPIERYSILLNGAVLLHMNTVEQLVRRRIRREVKRKPGVYGYCLEKNPQIVFQFENGRFVPA
jgi:hypothetical protein